MKKRCFYISILILILVVIGSCSLGEDNPEGRVKAFLSDLNAGSRSAANLQSHFSSSVSVYGQMNIAWFQARFPAEYTYSMPVISSSGNTVTGTLIKKDGNNVIGTNNPTFTLEKDGKTYLIRKIENYGGSTIQ